MEGLRGGGCLFRGGGRGGECEVLGLVGFDGWLSMWRSLVRCVGCCISMEVPSLERHR